MVVVGAAHVFLEGPRAVLAANHRARSPEGAGKAATWSLEEVATAAAARLPSLTFWPYEVQLFAPEESGRPRLLSQAAYSARFAELHPLAAAVLQKVNKLPCPPGKRGGRIVVAGGAAAAPFSGKAGGGVDFHVVGADPGDPRELWAAAERVLGALREIDGANENPLVDYANPRLAASKVLLLRRGVLLVKYRWAPRRLPLVAREDRSSGLFEARPSDERPGHAKRSGRSPGAASGGREVKIVLRAFPSVSALLHGFDLGAGAVAYDGETARLSAMGAFAQLWGANLVDPPLRSKRYEERLVKYFGRGYALALVGLKKGLCRPRAPPLCLSRLRLEALEASSPWAVRGRVRARGPRPPGRAAEDRAVEAALLAELPFLAFRGAAAWSLVRRTSLEEAEEQEAAGGAGAAAAVARRNFARFRDDCDDYLQAEVALAWVSYLACPGPPGQSSEKNKHAAAGLFFTRDPATSFLRAPPRAI